MLSFLREGGRVNVFVLIMRVIIKGGTFNVDRGMSANTYIHTYIHDTKSVYYTVSLVSNSLYIINQLNDVLLYEWQTRAYLIGCSGNDVSAQHFAAGVGWLGWVVCIGED